MPKFPLTLSTPAGAGGASTPGGSDGQVQYNNGGALGGEPNFIYDDTNKQIQITAGTVITAGFPTVILTGNGNRERIEIRSFNNTASQAAPALMFISASGTGASPTATASGAPLMTLSAGGYDNAGTPAIARSKGLVRFLAAEAWTTAAQGCDLEVQTTALASTTRAVKFQVTANGNIVCGALAALANNANDGFLYVPQTSSNIPTGTPTTYTGKAAMCISSNGSGGFRANFYVAGTGWTFVELST